MSLKSIKAGIYFFIFYFCLSCVPTIDVFSELTSEDIDDRFYIKFDTGHYEGQGLAVPLYELSSNDTIGLIDCGIDKNTESVEDLYCILDLNEADIGVLGQAEEGIPIQYNVPREMCEYTTFMAPWHWNQRSGIGPLSVDECKVTNEDSETFEEETWIRSTGTGWILQEEDQEESCDYDLSESGLSNCCFGMAETTQYKSTTGSVDDCTVENESDTAEKEWGGELSNCIGGPVRSSDWPAQRNVTLAFINDYKLEIEYPIPQVFSSWTRGRRETFMVGPIFQDRFVNKSTPTVNYFDGIEDLIFTDNPPGFFPGENQRTNSYSCPDCPLMFFPDESRKDENSPQVHLPIGYPYFTLECLDSNFDALHRTHLMIREWNTKEEFLNFKDSDGRSGDPDLDGEEGGDCPYYEADEILGNTNCNDFQDLDDFNTLNSYPKVDYENSGGGGGGN